MKDAYKVGTLFNGLENGISGQVIVTVTDGVFGEVFPWNAEEDLAAKGFEIHDFGSAFAMPGMIDGHVHITLPGDGTAAEDFYADHTLGEVLLQAAENGRIALKAGVTAMRDCGAKPQAVFDLRRSIQRGVTKGPDLVLCGSSLTVTGGHTHFFEGETDTPDETVKKIRELHKMGADFVKLITTGGGTKGVVQSAQMLSDAQIKAACDEAHRLGKIATAHVCTTDTAWAAVNGGVDMIEHMIFANEKNTLKFDEKLADLLAEKNIPVCITMGVLVISIRAYESLDRRLTKAEQAEYDMLRRFTDTIFEGFRRTCDRVTYIPGTDAGWRKSKFNGLVSCMEPMAELGMGSLKVLESVTGVAARLTGLSDRAGTVEEGKQADLVILRKSPVEDIKNVAEIETVLKNGVPV